MSAKPIPGVWITEWSGFGSYISPISSERAEKSVPGRTRSVDDCTIPGSRLKSQRRPPMTSNGSSPGRPMMRSHSTEMPARLRAETPATNRSAWNVRPLASSAFAPIVWGPVSTETTPARLSSSASPSPIRSTSTSIVCRRMPRRAWGSRTSASQLSLSPVRLKTESMNEKVRTPGELAIASMSACILSREKLRIPATPFASKQ
ncbi:MAG: hypothetical protein WC971_06490 [Coriobacteriia bacterium]